MITAKNVVLTIIHVHCMFLDITYQECQNPRTAHAPNSNNASNRISIGVFAAFSRRWTKQITNTDSTEVLQYIKQYTGEV